MMRWSPLLLAVCLVAGTAAPAPAGRGVDAARLLRVLDDIPVPSEWAGIYDTQFSIYICGEETPVFSQATTDTICGGEVYDPGTGNATCTGTYTDTSVDLECTWSEEVVAGCTASYRLTLTGSRTANSIQQTVIINVTYAGETCGEEFVDICTRTVITGTRTGPAPAECSTPVEAVTWGSIKSRIR